MGTKTLPLTQAHSSSDSCACCSDLSHSSHQQSQSVGQHCPIYKKGGLLCGYEQDKGASEFYMSLSSWLLTHGNKSAAFTAVCCGSALVF